MIRRSSVLSIGLALFLSGVAACGGGEPVRGAGSSGPRLDVGPEDPADFGPLPDFRLVSERGRPVSLDSLRGRPLVFAALFSTCTGPCPSVAGGLKRLQESLRDTDVLLVVVSVNPGFDSPEVLARYAEHVGADPERWIFLTGAEPEVYGLVREGFFLAVDRAGAEEETPGDPVTHDTRLLAVDREGHRRGWYAGTDEHQVERLRRRMLFLAAREAQEE